MRFPPSFGVVVLASACCLAVPAFAVVEVPPGFEDEVVVQGLSDPTSLAFLPDGRLFITEKQTGNIWLITADGVRSESPVAVVHDVRTDYVERGLLSVAVDPGWPRRPYVYAHYSSTSGFLRLIRFTATGTLSATLAGGDPAGLSLGNRYVVLDSIPDSNGPHNGGALRFGPDGKLYLSLGDDFDWCPAQDSTSLLGKVLRLNVSQLPPGPGGPPVRQRLAPFDNPWAWSADRNERLIYAKGFRNPFRFQIDRETGLLYVADVGDVSWEELDEVRAGDDAGWPFREGPTAFAAPPSCGPPGVGYLDPIDAYDHDEGAVILSAGVIRRKPGSLWPEEWEGNVLYADFENGFVRMLHYDGTKWERVPVAGVSDSRYLFSELYFVTDFQWGPDGSLWWLAMRDWSYGTSSGQLHRIRALGPVATSTTSLSLMAQAAVGAPARLMLAAAPNPARGEVQLTCTLPSAGPATLSIFDVSGRRVVTVFDGEHAAGRHNRVWEGRDAAGAVVRPGLYLAKLVTPQGVVTTRVLRVE